MALSSTNVKFSDVKTALGEETNSLKGLCTSNKINKWSLWKPIQKSSNINSVTDIYNSNCGFDIVEVKNGTISRNTISIEDWEYAKPTSNFRLGDFRNYNHSNTHWFNFSAELNSNNQIELKFNSVFPDFLNNLPKLKDYTFIAVVLSHDSGFKTTILSLSDFNGVSSVITPSVSFSSSAPANQWSVYLYFLNTLDTRFYGTWVNDSLSNIDYIKVPTTQVVSLKANTPDPTYNFKLVGTIRYSISGSLCHIDSINMTVQTDYSGQITLSAYLTGVDPYKGVVTKNNSNNLSFSELTGSYDILDNVVLCINLTYNNNTSQTVSITLSPYEDEINFDRIVYF